MLQTIGFHKIKDFNFLNKSERSKERIYKTVLNNVDNLRDKIANSHFINDINIRLETITELETMLDTNKETYYTKSNYYGNFTNINYDFAMYVKENNCYMSFY